MRIHLRISKTPLEKTRTRALKLINELRGYLVFQGRTLWRTVFQKILLPGRREKCLFLSPNLPLSLDNCDAERVILD
jgi:hypothetical protein